MAHDPASLSIHLYNPPHHNPTRQPARELLPKHQASFDSASFTASRKTQEPTVPQFHKCHWCIGCCCSSHTHSYTCGSRDRPFNGVPGSNKTCSRDSGMTGRNLSDQQHPAMRYLWFSTTTSRCISHDPSPSHRSRAPTVPERVGPATARSVQILAHILGPYK